MTRIEFVLLADNASAAALYEAVRLHVQTAKNPGGFYVHTQSQSEARALDQFLCENTLSDSVCHGIAEPDSQPHFVAYCETKPVRIGCDTEPDGTHRTLINLTPAVPWFFSRFEHCIELVRAGENNRTMGRERYLYYKRRGYPLSHRQL